MTKPSTRWSRWLIVALTLLTGCDGAEKAGDLGEPFLRGFNVGSGKYYLVLSDEYSGQDSLLFDDPQVLKRYKDQIRIKKSQFKSMLFGEGGSGQLSLWRKGKDDGPVLSNHRTYNGFIPDAMAPLGKVIGRKETYSNQDDFLQRVFALKSVEGVAFSFFHRSKRKLFSSKSGMQYQELTENKNNRCTWPAPDREPAPCAPYHAACELSFVLYAPGTQAAAPGSDVLQSVTSVMFPAIITRADEAYSIAQTLQAMRLRIRQELARLHIDGYYVVGQAYEFSRGFYASNDYRAGIVLHADYALPDRFLHYPDYNAYAFGVRIFCSAACQEKLAATPMLDWLHSPVSHDAFLADLQTFLQRYDKTLAGDTALSGGDYQSYPLFGGSMEHEPGGAASVALWRSGWMRQALLPPVAASDQESWHIRWGYDLDRALTEPYPAALLNLETAVDR